MKNVKAIFLPISSAVVGIIIFIFSLGGISSGFQEIIQRGASIHTGRFYDERPLRGIEAVAVNSRGEIHFSLNQELLSHWGSIQVYNNEGVFLYGFSFPTSTGMLLFHIDEDDVVHVLPVREGKVFSFYEGELIGYRRHANNVERNATTTYIMALQDRTEFADKHGNQYTVPSSQSRNIRMYDPYGNFLRVIRPNAPTWPLPLFGSLFVGIIGIGLVIVGATIFVKTVFRKQSKR